MRLVKARSRRILVTLAVLALVGAAPASARPAVALSAPGLAVANDAVTANASPVCGPSWGSINLPICI